MGKWMYLNDQKNVMINLDKIEKVEYFNYQDSWVVDLHYNKVNYETIKCKSEQHAKDILESIGTS
jgi:hypothetical protein